MSIINPLLARYAADLNDAIDKLSLKPEHREFFEVYGPVGVKMYTVDGLTAEFFEEGIEFYPEGA
jgi:hypothetical protein